MPKHFNTIKRLLSDDEKRDRVLYYNELNDDLPMDVEAFVKSTVYDETVIMKCLKCGFQEEVDFDIISEFWSEFDSDYPVSYCGHCSKPKLVPLDIYNQIKHIK